MFKRGLQEMGACYASMCGTTVLVQKTVPAQPDDERYKGAVWLFGLAAGVDEARIREALAAYGVVASCEVGSRPATFVRFSTHDAALKCKQAAAELTHLCQGVDTVYNARPYDDRGWPQFEQGAATVVAALLAAAAQRGQLPPHLARAEASRAKVIDISACAEEGGRARVMEADCDPAQLLDLTVRAVRAAAFTGKGDKEVVVAMLERFVYIVESAGVRAVQAATATRGLELSVNPRVLAALVREQTARDAAARGDEGGEGGGVELLSRSGYVITR